MAQPTAVDRNRALSRGEPSRCCLLARLGPPVIPASAPLFWV